MRQSAAEGGREAERGRKRPRAQRESLPTQQLCSGCGGLRPEGEGRERPRAASAKRLGPKAEGQDSQKKPRLCNICNTVKDLKNCLTNGGNGWIFRNRMVCEVLENLLLKGVYQSFETEIQKKTPEKLRHY